MENSNIFKRGTIWPYAIIASIVIIIIASLYTVTVALSRPISASDLFMQNYHEANRNINEIIKARASFDKLYKIDFTTKQLTTNNTSISYKVTDINNNPVNNAVVDVVVTRPNVHHYDITLNNPIVNNGVYSFENITLAKEGRWDIMAKVSINNDYRYYNLKADTRYPQTIEY